MGTYSLSIIPIYHDIKRWKIYDNSPVDIGKSISCRMISVLKSTAGVRGCESWVDQSKDYTISMCYFAAMHASLKDKNKEWWAPYQDKFWLGYGV